MNYCCRIVFVALIFFMQLPLRGQLVSRLAAVDSALKNHPEVAGAAANIERQKALKRGAAMVDKTEVWIEAPSGNRFALGVQQNFNFPSVYVNESRLQKQQVVIAEKELEISKISVARNTELIYLNHQFSIAQIDLLFYQDSLYGKMVKAVDKRYSVGDAGYLEKIMEESKYLEIRNQLEQAYKDLTVYEMQLRVITGLTQDSIITEELAPFQEKDWIEDTSIISSHPMTSYYLSNIKLSEQQHRLQRSMLYPGFFAGFLNQGDKNSDFVYRLRFGVGIPLWFPSYTARIRSARIGIDVAQLQYKSNLNSMKLEYVRVLGQLQKNRGRLQYYRQTALNQADEIIRSSTVLYNTGEITYFAYLQALSHAMTIKMSYLQALKNYNESVIELKYIEGE